MKPSPAFRGGLLALLAACLFGASTPLVQHFGRQLGPFTTAALLYAGAALIGAALRKPLDKEARLLRTDWRRLLAVAAFGAVIGPVALAWGLQRTSGTSASLMLTLEAFFTAVFAWLLYRETMDRRVWAAMALLLGGGALLVLDQSGSGTAQLAGMLAVLLATAAWGFDNTLSRALAERDPGQVVLAKAALGAAATAMLAFAVGEPLPSLAAGLALLAVGASGYGLSLRFYLLAQREFGAARTGSVFAFAPFIGGLVAFVGFRDVVGADQSVSWLMAAGGLLMLAGVLLHLMEKHVHQHLHLATEHEHAHSHDDGHHDHLHADLAAGQRSPHSHLHLHEPAEHNHAHVPDAHHSHSHRQP